MLQKPLPQEIVQLSPEETDARIATARRCLGEELIILGHHYQRDEIIKWADFRGDSLLLSQIAGKHPEAKYFIFCGVHFMAESADILTRPDQIVILPNMNAGCSMADMANIGQVERAWEQLGTITDTSRIVPITYVNSTAAIKAFVGRHGGASCTSSNARKVVQWALERGDKLFFLPDQHLGRNTCVALGLDPEKEMLLWDPTKPLGGNSPEDIRAKRVYLWKGHCSVHMRFTVEQIQKARQEYPNVNVIVHPECTLDVVQAADAYGSTEFITKTIRAAPAGTVWAVGTEINLVKRLADEMPDKTIFCLDPIVCPCSTMYRIHPHYLLWAMESLVRGEVVNRVQVPPEIAKEARMALDRMLSIV
ncbi:quinolinate synthase NadA [Chthonomonas calidirosea]|uniref:quinolinate synthase NadA n=1 Tax=Chthonomonas calidirosea TaxID=454171 RepID=UPI0006ECBE73|nr:quinolinate synthase NadA [Chthonomonas calidirosea]CEK16818.1 quinolinate synthetase [Chthonomonas calidirosea]